MIYLFVHDDSLTSKRFTTRTEQLTKWCEPLQKMRVRLNLAEKALALTFVPNPRVRGEGVSVRVPCTFHSVPTKISRYAFVLKAQVNK